MNNDTLVWNKILTAVLKMPGVKVNRTDFLRKALKQYCNESKLSMLDSVRPYTIASDKIIDSVASSCITRHTALATGASTLAGLPGGLAMAATIPSDITQYYFHVLVLAQKLAYLYGFPDFCDEEGELSDNATDLLTIFVGVMMGAKVADQGISELASGMAKQAVGRLPRMAITKAAILPIVEQVAKAIGLKLSKEGFAKSIGKFIPIAGGLFSGTLTLATFQPAAKRLQKRLRAQKAHFSDSDITALEFNNIKASLAKADRVSNDPKQIAQAQIEAMINMANIGSDMSHKKYQFIENAIAKTALSSSEKLDLLGNVDSDYSYDVDFDMLATDPDIARQTTIAMINVMNIDQETPSMAEKIYLSMAAKTLGITKEELSQLMNGEEE